MAVYQVSIVDCGCNPNSEGCKSLGIVVEDNSNQLVVGNVYSFSGRVEFGCYVVQGLKLTIESPNTIIINSYGPENPSGCTDCITDISDYLEFISCDRNYEFIIPKTQISPIPAIDDILFIDLYFSTESGLQQFSSCFTFIGLTSTIPDNDVFVSSASTVFADCETCTQNSPLIYSVSECIGGNIYYMILQSSGLENHLITFTDLVGLTQYCGIVQSLTSVPTTGVFINDLGVYDEELGIDCDYCNGLVNEKKKLVNCLGGLDQIVWASVLFEPGNSTHLSLGDGCYEISPDVVPSGETITINELANYDPQEDCEDCLECYGVIYDYITCEQFETCSPINLIDTSSNSLSSGRNFKIDSFDFAFIPFAGSNQIAKVDLNSQTIVEQSGAVLTSPLSLDIDDNNLVICVTNSGTFLPTIYDVTFFDYNNLSLSSNLIISGAVPNNVYYNTNDGYFYVTTSSIGGVSSIYVYSGLSYNTMGLVTSFGSISQNYGEIIQIGSLIYVINQNANSIDIYNDFSGGLGLNTSVPLPTTPYSFTFNSSNNILYISTNTNYYIKLDVATNLYSIITYNSCSSVNLKIKFNSSNNRLYITDPNCDYIFEFNTTTDTLLKTYNNLNSNGINQVYGIDIDTSGNTWFSSYDDLFQLGCNNDFIIGQTTSNEYLSASTVFFNYQLSACCVITTVTSITNISFLNITENISMLHFEDCQTCTGSTQDVFYCVECVTGVEGVLLAPQGSYSAGQFVRSQFGNSDWLCFEIVEPYSGQTSNPISFVTSGSSFNTCEQCESGATLGLTLVNCDTLQPSRFNVTLNEWFEITGFPSQLPNSVVSDINGVCYQVTNSCPIDNVHPSFNPQNFYLNQLFCRVGNRPSILPTISAGTEATICSVCWDGTGYTATIIHPPHPTWTNGSGQAVVQLNAITLGGPNGLNN
jgi:hypothetical protein